MKNTKIFLLSLMVAKSIWAVDNTVSTVENPSICAIQKVYTCHHTSESADGSDLVFTLVEKNQNAQIVQYQGDDLYGSHHLQIQSKSSGFAMTQTVYLFSDQSTLKISEQTIVGRGGVSRGGEPLSGLTFKWVNALLTKDNKEYEFSCN